MEKKEQKGKRLTLQDIARLAETSPSTVSRVLHHKPDVRPDTRERILRLLKEHHYVLRFPIDKKVQQAKLAIGVLIPPLTWPLIPEVLNGIVDFVADTPYALHIYSFKHPEEYSTFIDRILETRMIAGLLAVFPRHALDHVATLHEHGLPVVLIDDQGPMPDTPWVGIDNRHGAYVAVRHLLRLGHRRIAHIVGPYECSRQRYRGYCDALLESGITPDFNLVQFGDFEVAGGRACAHALFSQKERPTAIFVGNDPMAYGVIAVAEEYAVRIPEDVALVGFDDIPMSARMQPALTTIRQPFSEMGRYGVDLLLSLVDPHYVSPHLQEFLPSDKSGAPVHIELPTSLVVRDSCGDFNCVSISLE